VVPTELNLDVSLSLIGGYRKTGIPSPAAARIAFLDRIPFVQGDGAAAYDVSQPYLDEQGTVTTSRSFILSGSFELDPFGNAVALSAAKYVYFKNTHASTSIVVTGNFWKCFNASGLTMTVEPGERLIFVSPSVTAMPVVLGVSDTITLTASSATYSLIVAGILSQV
jgi:hypothetical protein